MRRRALLVLVWLLAAVPAMAGWRWQSDFVADKWSWVHAAGSGGLYAGTRLAGAPPAKAIALSLGAGLAWEVCDGFKPPTGDMVTSSDGFSWSDLVYDAAGVYFAWLLVDTTGLADRVGVVPLRGGGAAVEIGWSW